MKAAQWHKSCFIQHYIARHLTPNQLISIWIWIAPDKVRMILTLLVTTEHLRGDCVSVQRGAIQVVVYFALTRKCVQM